VLDNLLSNAMQYTDVGDRITVSLVLLEDTVSLCVADTGMGIPKADLSRVFERFYRGDKSRRGAGTGLGLAIVREIVEAHNGTITVESVVDVGTRFLITLPTP
jgi:signal transduction histidine kinase